MLANVAVINFFWEGREGGRKCDVVGMYIVRMRVQALGVSNY